MSKRNKIELKNEVDKIHFECSKCGCTNFVLDTWHINRYGELACPMCFSNDNIKVIFLNYKRSERRR